MNDTLSIDTLDILAVAIGGVIALTLLPADAAYSSERFAVGICALATVSIKRLFIKTKKRNPLAKRATRMVYLLIALVGTSCCGLALIGFFAKLEEFSEPYITEGLLGAGLAMLVIAAFIDNRWLKLS